MAGENPPANKHLSDAKYQKTLYELLDFYDKELQELIEWVTIECNGDRPAGLENEIYSVFHHICRSIFHKGSVEEACRELETARNSHLQRVQYDAYKIVLNAALKKSDKLVSDYEPLLLDSDFSNVWPKAVDIIQNIKKTRKTVKDAYIEAKKYEKRGEKTEAVKKYNEAISSVPILDEKIAEIENDEKFSIALLSIKKKHDSAKQNTKIAIIGTIIAAIATVLGAILGAILNK